MRRASLGAGREGSVQFGVCCGWDNARSAIAAGFDYIEIGAVSIDTVPTEKNISTPVTNLFFPGDFTLYGPEASPYLEYADKLFDKAAERGVEIMVIGSGPARMAKNGTNPKDAERLFVDIVAKMQDLATKRGITLAPEPLNHLETNVGNDLSWLATALKEKGCAYTADSYHVFVEWRRTNDEALAPDKDYLARYLPHCPAHVHFSDICRLYPRSLDPMIVAFVERLRALNFDGRVSLECKWLGLENEMKVALNQLRRIFE